MFAVPRSGLFRIPRYGLLLIIALDVQAAVLWLKLGTWDEVKAITLFHVIGFAPARSCTWRSGVPGPCSAA